MISKNKWQGKLSMDLSQNMYGISDYLNGKNENLRGMSVIFNKLEFHEYNWILMNDGRQNYLLV